MKDLTKAVLALGALVLELGRVERNTYHEDGVRPETDTDHTVMLGIVACALAEKLKLPLDRGQIAQFALVHDLVEAYAGDTVTIKCLTKEAAAEKAAREAAALTRIKEEFGATLPWVHETIETYESLATPEARFVKMVDKAMPAVTHALNEGATIRKECLSEDAHQENQEANRARYAATFAHDQPEALALYDEMTRIAQERMRYA